MLDRLHHVVLDNLQLMHTFSVKVSKLGFFVICTVIMNHVNCISRKCNSFFHVLFYLNAQGLVHSLYIK